MIKSFYGLRADPFPLSPDHSESFPHFHFVKARDYIDYALRRGDGIVMITGKPGTGKTTLVNDLKSRIDPAKVKLIVLVTTQLEAEDLLRMVAYSLGLSATAPNKALVLQEIMRSLEGLSSTGRRALLVIDEAQDLATSALEELRLLTNLEHAGKPLLQLLLIGQEQLRERVRRPEMEQVHQRLVAAWHLEPLSPSETMRYVAHRLHAVGWSSRPSFAPGVLGAVYAYSGGTPRLINLMCSRLMLRGIVTDEPVIRLQDAELVMAELRDETLTLPDWCDTGQTWDSSPELSGPLPVPAVSDPKGLERNEGSPSSECVGLAATAAVAQDQPSSDIVSEGTSPRMSPESASERLWPTHQKDSGASSEQQAEAGVTGELRSTFPVDDQSARTTDGTATAARSSAAQSPSPVEGQPPVDPPSVAAVDDRRSRVRFGSVAAVAVLLLLLAGGLYLAKSGQWPVLLTELGLGPPSAVTQEARATSAQPASAVPFERDRDRAERPSAD